jgi:hypothetical protein
VIFAAAFDRMLPEWVSTVEPRTRTPIIALLLMVIPSAIISFLYAYNILNFRTLVLDATLVIAVTFLGTTVAAIILPWKQKEVYVGSPIGKYNVPAWLGWLVTAVFAVGSIYLIINSVRYGVAVFTGLAGAGLATPINYIVVSIVWALTIINIILLAWLTYYVAKGVMKDGSMPLITLAGLIFLLFLDWLLIEWFWDPHVPPFDFAYYAIGWKNISSMVYMILNYALAAAIYFGFNAFRRRQGIDVDKVYKEIPVE